MKTWPYRSADVSRIDLGLSLIFASPRRGKAIVISSLLAMSAHPTGDALQAKNIGSFAPRAPMLPPIDLEGPDEL
jgi:hypothetical protein